MTALVTNREAKFDYDISDTFEAGLVLTGAEVKSAKRGHMSLKGAYAIIRSGEAWLLNATITAYPPAGPQPDYDPHRSRKLLLKRREIDRLTGSLSREHLTLIPLEVYTHRGLLKIKLGLGRSRKKYEKREVIKRRAVDREVRSEMRPKR